MSTQIAYGQTVVTPTVVDGWEQEHESSTTVHRLISGGTEVTHAPAGPRTFTLKLVFPVEADAAACVDLHRTAPFLDLTSTDRTFVNGRYVVAEGGRVAVDLDDVTRNVWVVTVDATEVTP